MMHSKTIRHKILAAWGTSFFTPAQISRTLCSLNIEHTIIGASQRFKWSDQRTIDGLNEGQPAWPIVCHEIKDIFRAKPPKEPTIVFVCDSIAALSNTNIPILQHKGLHDTIKQALEDSILDMSQEWRLTSTEPKIMEYVALSSKPSFLNEVQTSVYKITPYSERKIIQTALILFLGNRISLKAVKKVLQNNLKAEHIMSLLNSPGASSLKAAMAEVKLGVSTETAAANNGLDVFDVNYIHHTLNKKV